MSEQRPRRRMDRNQLNEARRTIARLVRSKTVSSRKRKPAEPIKPTEPERPEGYRQTLHVGCYARDLANLDKIVENLKLDPVIGGLHANIGREKAARFAFAKCAENLPAAGTTGSRG